MFVLALLLALARFPQKLRDFFPPGDSRVPAALAEVRPTRPNCEVRAPDGSTWRCTPRGAIRRLPGGGAEYYAGKRYLPDDQVTNIFPESRTVVWIATAGGVSRIEFRNLTLEEKAGYFEERIEKRHDRYGFVASSELLRPGDLSSNRLVPSDNDGLWTAIYIAAEAFRYAVTGDPEAADRARRSLQALMRLEQITGIPGFPARSYIRKGDFRHQEGAWHFTPDGQFEWKGDTSSDEVAGHYFAYALYYDLVATEPEKRAIRAVVDRITTHLLDHSYALIDITGKPTTWAQYGPEYIAHQPDEFALNSMLLLSHLRAAHHITGKQRFLDEYNKLVRMGYADNTTKYLEKRIELNYSDEEMAMLGYYPLFLYERDKNLRSIYIQGLDQWWENCQREKNPLWTYIYDFATRKRVGLDDARSTLARIPMDLVTWTVENSHRPGVTMSPETDRFQKPQATVLLPPDERPVMKWNSNPFRVDGGNGGRSEDDGTFYLLPYWMGRYYKYLDAP